MNEIAKKTDYREYNEADKIIRYLLNPNEPVDLTDTEKHTLDIVKKVNDYRYQFHSAKFIVNLLVSTENIKERQAYNYLKLTEEVFGKIGRPDKDYERTFLINKSLENLKIAFNSKNSKLISAALLVHAKLTGIFEVVPDMPDFSALQPHLFEINLPDNVQNMLQQMLQKGVLNLSDYIPPPNINTAGYEEAKTD